MNRLNGARNYLAGPIEHASDGGTEWRKEITPFFESLGIKVLNPCDKPVALGKETIESQLIIKELKQLFAKCDRSERDYYGDKLHAMMKEIVGTDLRLVDICDFLVAYIDPNIYACGTFDEITRACIGKKPVIVYAPVGLDTIPSWLFSTLKHQMFFDSITELKSYVRHINEDETIDDLDRWRFMDWNNF